MELMLVGVSVLSFVIATGMSLIAWKLLREQDERSSARVALLQAAVDRAIDEPEAPPLDDLDLRSAAFAARARAAGFTSRQSAATSAGGTPVLAAARQRAESVSTEPDFDDDPWDFKKLGEPGADRPAVRVVPADDLLSDLPLPVAAHLFEPPAAPPASTRRMVAAGVVGLIVIGAAGTPYAIRGGHALALFGGIAADASASTAGSGVIAGPPMELIALDHESRPDDSFVVTGAIANPASGRTMTDLSAIVSLFDVNGELVATGKGTVTQSTILPGQAATFTVQVPDAVGVARYRVGFRLSNGGVVAHLDRRTESQGGTLGAVDRTDHAPRTPPLTPRKTEG